MAIFQGAIYHAKAALEIVPTYPDPHDSLAFGYTQKGMDVRRFRNTKRRSVMSGMHNTQTTSLLHNGYGTSLARTGHVQERANIFAKVSNSIRRCRRDIVISA